MEQSEQDLLQQYIVAATKSIHNPTPENKTSTTALWDQIINLHGKNVPTDWDEMNAVADWVVDLETQKADFLSGEAIIAGKRYLNNPTSENKKTVGEFRERIRKQKNRDLLADSIIRQAAVGSSVVAGTPMQPEIDQNVNMLIGSWSAMLKALAVVYDVQFDENVWKTMAKKIFMITVSNLIGPRASYFLNFIGNDIAVLLAKIALGYASTRAIGNMYKNAWREGREPSEEELKTTLSKSE